VFVEFASLENIELRMNENDNEIVVLYKDTDIQNMPIIRDDGASVSIIVSKNALDLKGTQKNKYRAGQPLYPSYILIVPKGVDMQILYEKGNFITEKFQGNLDLRLGSGVVDLNEFNGAVTIDSFSGKINCAIKSAKIKVNSSRTKIISSLKDERLIEKQKSVEGIFKNANNVLNINTIQAKVNLKPMSTQK